MKTTKFTISVLIIILSSSFLISCDKDEDTNNNTSETRCYIKTTKTKEGTNEYTYTDNLLSLFSIFDTNHVSLGHSTLSYSNQILSEINSFDKDGNRIENITTEITNGKITRFNHSKYHTNGSIDKSDYYVCTYNTNNKISRIDYYNLSDSLKSYNEYNWDTDNLHERKSYRIVDSTFVLDYTVTYTYDNKNNPLYNIGINLFLSDVISKNNSTRSVFVYSGTPSISTDYTYEYTSKSYPLKLTITSSNNYIREQEYTYSCD